MGPRPLGFEFTRDGHSIFLTAQGHRYVTLYRLELQPNAIPELVFENGPISSHRPFPRGGGDELLVSSSTFVES